MRRAFYASDIPRARAPCAPPSPRDHLPCRRWQRPGASRRGRGRCRGAACRALVPRRAGGPPGPPLETCPRFSVTGVDLSILCDALTVVPADSAGPLQLQVPSLAALAVQSPRVRWQLRVGPDSESPPADHRDCSPSRASSFIRVRLGVTVVGLPSQPEPRSP